MIYLYIKLKSKNNVENKLIRYNNTKLKYLGNMGYWNVQSKMHGSTNKNKNDEFFLTINSRNLDWSTK